MSSQSHTSSRPYSPRRQNVRPYSSRRQMYPSRMSPSRSPQSPKRSTAKNEDEKFFEDFKIITTNMILDADFTENIEQYREWLLSPKPLRLHPIKRYQKICEKNVNNIIDTLYQFHTKKLSEKQKNSKINTIVFGVAAAISAATAAYLSAGLIDAISRSLIIGTVGGLSSLHIIDIYKALTSKEKAEVAKIEEIFEEYLNCVKNI